MLEDTKRKSENTESSEDLFQEVGKGSEAQMNNQKAQVSTHEMAYFSLIFMCDAETWILGLKNYRKINALRIWCWRRKLKIPWINFRTSQLHYEGKKEKLPLRVQL